jgi:hypothetical protein
VESNARAGGSEPPERRCSAKVNWTLLGEGISSFGDVPDALRLFFKILRFHIKLENRYGLRKITV